VESVDYIEAQDDYIAIHAGGRSHLKQQPIAAIETALDPGRFVRIHRSYILNIDRLARIELYAKDSRVAILRDGARLPLSRAGHARLRGLLHE
jgi:two-component system, LytTR family, response regulator